MISAFKHRLTWLTPKAWLLLIVFVCLAPFVNKAFHIDDTLFLRAAEQIQKKPLDFYGFKINWIDRTLPMSEYTENPPLASYYIALIAHWFGWREWTLHLAFLLPALAAAWGIYSLAGNYCRRPFVAALAAVLTPVFLISATSLMCDVTLLALWVWALVLFERGLRAGGVAAFAGCGFLAGLAVWTKFFGLALVPLLVVYGFSRSRRAGWWLMAPIIPLLFAGFYEWLGFQLYGHEMFLSAAAYSNNARLHSPARAWERIIIGLGFAGGCLLPALFWLPGLLSRRVLLAAAGFAAAGLLAVPHTIAFAWVLWPASGGIHWGVLLESVILTTGGAGLVFLAVADLWNRRTATSLLLFLWMAGTLVFSIGLNWTINGRSLLPAVPVVGILLARRIEDRQGHGAPVRSWQILGPSLAAGVVGLLLVAADYQLAGAYRTAARNILAKYPSQTHELWFEGHWGFQYYMEQGGAKAMDYSGPQPETGDIVVVPGQIRDNSFQLDTSRYRLLETMAGSQKTFCATMDAVHGAGFYASDLGPLPFSVTGAEPMRFWVYRVLPETDEDYRAAVKP